MDILDKNHPFVEDDDNAGESKLSARIDFSSMSLTGLNSGEFLL